MFTVARNSANRVACLACVFMTSLGVQGCNETSETNGDQAQADSTTDKARLPTVHTIPWLLKECNLVDECPKVPACDGKSYWISGHIQWINAFNPEVDGGIRDPKFFFFNEGGNGASVGDVLGNTGRFLEVYAEFGQTDTFFKNLWAAHIEGEEFSKRARVRVRVRTWMAHGMKCPTRIELELKSPEGFEWE